MGVFQWCNHDRDWHSFCCEYRDLQIATEFWQETSPKLHIYIYTSDGLEICPDNINLNHGEKILNLATKYCEQEFQSSTNCI